MSISSIEFSNIIQLITRCTGIVPRESHTIGIKRYIESRLQALAANDSGFSYYAYLDQNPQEVIDLVNGSTINETYFFREEKQFDLLQKKVLPALVRRNAAPLHIWSAACSSGEEIYSLALLVKSCGIPATFTASDINTVVLQKCRDGQYKANSLRTVDGARFHGLLRPYQQKDKTILLPEELRAKVNTMQLNLAHLAESPIPAQTMAILPQNQHLIFIRNVFIYFTQEMRAKILKTLATHCLAEGGYLFVSMNEVASINSEVIPAELEKVVDGVVFYFHRKA